MKHLKLILLFTIGTLFLNSCKKDKIQVNETKVFISEAVVTHTQPSIEGGGWVVTLMPDGSADVVPGGDIRYPGKYKINGSKLKIDCGHIDFEFDILSDKEIKEKEYGTLLKLRLN